MKRHILSLFSLIFAVSISAQVPDAYKTKYATLAGKSGVNLFDAVSAIAADGYRSHSYKDLWTYFRTTDLTAQGKIWDMYSDCTFTPGSDQCGTYSGVCDCYNREHSLPKSWFGGSDSNAPGTDLFHLYPTDGKVNGDRGNLPFGECAGTPKTHYKGKIGASTISGYSGNVFEPDDIYKGDFARSYFGMLVRYGKSFALNQADGGDAIFSNTNKSITASNHYGLTNYGVELLMSWHGMDEVSQKETDRNNGIQQTQGNRNPFIDCPVLAEYFWGAKAGQAVALQDLVDCGCADSNGQQTAVEKVSAFPSLTLTQADGLIMLTCLPESGNIAVFNASGMLLSMTAIVSPEMELSLPQGFYMLLIASGTGKQSFKVLVK